MLVCEFNFTIGQKVFLNLAYCYKFLKTFHSRFPSEHGSQQLLKLILGPHSRVRTAGHSAQPPIEVSGNFSAHVSAE